MSTTTAPSARLSLDADVPADLRPITTAAEAAEFPHQCDPETLTDGPAPVTRRSRRSRLVGLDVARGLALVGMVAVHTITSDKADGSMSPAWVLANGKASALFAVLGGVGLAFMTGRRRPPQGKAALRAALSPLVRGLLLVLFGLALGGIVPASEVSIVLTYLGTVFMMAALLTPLRARSLLILGLAWTVIGPVISQVVRQGTSAQEPVNLGLGALGNPELLIRTLLFTGAFPAITWFAYICIGMAIGRANLSARLVIAKLIAGGSLLALATSVFASILVDGLGLRERIAADVAGTMTLDTFTNYLVFGGDGILPADSWWWLGVQAPHTGTPLDLLFTIGTSLAVIGACLALATVFGHRFSLLAVPGGMTLTLYSVHVLLIGRFREMSDGLQFTLHLVVLVLFALIWSQFFARGPLEQALRTLVRVLTGQRRRAAHTLTPAPTKAAVETDAEGSRRATATQADRRPGVASSPNQVSAARP